MRVIRHWLIQVNDVNEEGNWSYSSPVLMVTSRDEAMLAREREGRCEAARYGHKAMTQLAGIFAPSTC